MIQFQRDKDGNLYAVKNGKVVGRMQTIGDTAPQEVDKNGNSKKRKDRK